MNVQRISCGSCENFRKKSNNGRVNHGFHSQRGSCPEFLEYIASVENRPKRFFIFSLNFDIKK